EAEQRSGEISIFRMNHERDLMRMGSTSSPDLNPSTQAHAQVIYKPFFARWQQRKLPATRLSHPQAGIFVAIDVFSNLHHARSARAVEAQQAPLVVPVPAPQGKIGCRDGGRSLWQPKRQLAGVTLK